MLDCWRESKNLERTHADTRRQQHANPNPELCWCEVTFFFPFKWLHYVVSEKKEPQPGLGRSHYYRIGDKQTKATSRPISRDEGVHMLSHSWESLRSRPVRHIRSFRPATRAQNSCWHDSSCQAALLRETQTPVETFRHQSKLSTKNYAYFATLQTKDRNCLSAYQRLKRRVLS